MFRVHVTRGVDMTAACVHIEFTLRCTAQRYHAIAEEAASRMAEVPGLRAKWWWIDRQAGRAGGVYSFASRETAESYLTGPIVSALRTAPFCEGVETRIMELLEPDGRQAVSELSERASDAAATQRFAERVLGDISAAMTGVMVRLG